MVAAKNFQGGLQSRAPNRVRAVRMHLHHDFDPADTKTPLDVLDEVRKPRRRIIRPRTTAFPHGFSHIFGGG